MREAALIIHFIGLAMGLGTSFAFMFLGIASSKMEKNDGINFMLKAMSISRMGHIGLTLLILSGLYLMIPYWKTLGQSPLLIIKFSLVLVLAGLIGYNTRLARLAREGDAETQFKKSAPIGRLSLLTALLIVVMAVLHFN